MYLKSGLVMFLRIKNIMLLIFGMIALSISLAVLISVRVQFGENLALIFQTPSTWESLLFLFLGAGMIVYSRISRKLINQAFLFSGCFEGDLDGYVRFEDLAVLTGQTPETVRSRLRLFGTLYMKNFRITAPPGGGEEFVELYSKTVTCSCMNCGAPIEKSIYFTGKCPYCRGSDLKAEVITGERLYCIYDSASRKPSLPKDYQDEFLKMKHTGYAIGFGVLLLLFIVFLIVFGTMVSNYNKEDYLRGIFYRGNPYVPLSVIQSEVIKVIIFTGSGLTAVVLSAPILLVRLVTLESAEKLSCVFASHPAPYLVVNQISHSENTTSESVFKSFIESVSDGYLRNCFPEKVNGVLMIGLARKVVKDRCPGCGAPIVGAIHDNYRCQYCGRVITGVIQKVRGTFE